ncbi:hypothetical protein [Candidatus Odyssella acanthamoebae]|nr:hypothetical protein [Candidatus Paracaedibacter acanthamoebae]
MTIPTDEKFYASIKNDLTINRAPQRLAVEPSLTGSHPTFHR